MIRRDISLKNLMANEKNDGSWSAFLINLNLTIKEQRQEVSRAQNKTGTRAFMVVGVLLGEKHSFMHDLESFFWVLFWICIHFNSPIRDRAAQRFDKWNYVDTEELADLKKGAVNHEGDFLKTAENEFTSYYQPLVPWVNRLRKVVFPNGRRWKKENKGLYYWMKIVLSEARKKLEVSAV